MVLSWSQFKQGHLLSGSDDAHICLWDINETPKNKSLDAMQIFKVLFYVHGGYFMLTSCLEHTCAHGMVHIALY